MVFFDDDSIRCSFSNCSFFSKMARKNILLQFKQLFFLIILTYIVIHMAVSETVQSLPYDLLPTNMKTGVTFLGHIIFWDMEITHM